jgi:hypothetical protein
MRPRATTAAAVLGAAALAAFLGGCGTSGSSTGPPTGTDLLDRLSPAGQPAAVYVDLRASRAKLGVGDLDPRAIAANDLAQRRYAALYATAFPLLANPAKLPLLDMIDLAKAKAVATNGVGAGRRQVVVLATDQPFENLAAALVAAGYQRDGSMLHQPDAARSVGASTVAGGPGLIALGENADTVRAAAQGGAEGIRGPVRELVDSLGAPAILATSTAATCPTAIAFTDDIDGDRGRLVVVDAGANADRLTADDPNNTVLLGKRFDRPTIDHGRLTVTFSYQPDASPRPLEILPEASLRDLYHCG